MKKFFALLLVMILVLAGCSGKKESSNTPDTTGKKDNKTTTNTDSKDNKTGEADEIIVGCPQPLTGTNALVGDACVKGVQLAAKQINESGGLLGRKIKVIVYDDQASPEEAVKIANKMIQVDKVDLICGSLISSCMLSAGQYYEEAKIPCVGCGIGVTWMEKGWEYVFRACPNSGMAMPALAEYMKKIGIETVGIFHGQDESSLSSAEAFMDACKETGITVTTAEVYVEGDTDYSGQIAKIINTKPDAVFCSTFSVTQPAFAKQLRQLGYNGLVFNKETLSADNIAVAGDAANYWAFMFPYITYSSIEEAPEGTTLRKFLEDFYAEYNEMPFHDCAYRGYDSMKVLAAAVEKAGTLDGKAVRDALETIDDFEGIGGTYDFTQGDREGIHSFNAYIIIDQKPVDLDEWIESGEYEKFKTNNK